MGNEAIENRAWGRTWAAFLLSAAAVAMLLAAATSASAVSAPSITSPGEGSYDNDGSFVIYGGADPYNTVEVYEKDGQRHRVGSASASSTGRFAVSVRGASDGKRSYKARAQAAWGGAFSAWSGTRAVIVDTQASAPPIITSPASGADAKTSGFVASGTAEPDNTVELHEGTVSMGSAKADSSGNWSITVGSSTSGTHFSVTGGRRRPGCETAAGLPAQVEGPAPANRKERVCRGARLARGRSRNSA